MAVLRKIDASGDIHPNAGLERRGGFRIEDFRRDTEFIGERGGLCLLVERMLRLAEHHEAAFHEAKVERLREFPEALAARISAAPLALACALLATSCDNIEPCGVPGVTEVCECGPGVVGARVCMAEHAWAACDCSGAIPRIRRISPIPSPRCVTGCARVFPD